MAKGLQGTMPPPTRDERTWAALAHATILLAPWTGVGGMVASFFLWAEKKEDSAYIGWQGLQAWAYQVAVPALVAVLALAGWGLAGGWLRAQARALVAVAALMVLPAYIGYGCYAAYQCAQGQDFRYFALGRLLGRWHRRYYR